MRSFIELIDTATAPRLAELFEVPESHVRTMRARDSIPPIYWTRIVENASALGLSVAFEDLVNLRAGRHQRPRAGSQRSERAAS